MMMNPKPTDPNPKLQKRRPPLQAVIHKESDKFLSTLLSKESSMANPSFRVYYGGVAGSVPFIWESQPGTPKHSMAALFAAEESSLPPLTPPPSSFRSSGERVKATNSRGLFGRLLVRFGHRKPAAGARSMLIPVRTMDYLRRRRFSSRGSSFDSVVFSDRVDDEERDATPRHSRRLLCFGFGERTCRW